MGGCGFEGFRVFALGFRAMITLRKPCVLHIKSFVKTMSVELHQQSNLYLIQHVQTLQPAKSTRPSRYNRFSRSP